MPIPQVNDRIKEAPVVVLRAVFAGIGQLLLTADKVRSRAAEQAWMSERATAPAPPGQARHYPAPQEPRNGTARNKPAVAGRPVVREAAASPGTTTAPAAPAAPGGKASGGLAGSVPRTASGTAQNEAIPAAKPTPAAKTTPAAKSRPAKTAKAAPVAKDAKGTSAAKAAAAPRAAKTTPAAKATPAAEAPPLPGYDDLSLASLRGRLRTLDAATIQAVLAYEKAHARREPVITMLERRLAKISAG